VFGFLSANLIKIIRHNKGSELTLFKIVLNGKAMFIYVLLSHIEMLAGRIWRLLNNKLIIHYTLSRKRQFLALVRNRNIAF
jgi:hypothetical protein